MSLIRFSRALILLAFLSGVPASAEIYKLGSQTEHATDGDIENLVRGGIYKAAAGGDLDSITAYLNFQDLGGGFTYSVRFGVYSIGTTLVLIDSTAAFSVNASGWYSKPVLLLGTINQDSSYVICAWANKDNVDDIALVYATGQTGDTMVHKTTVYNNAWPNPLSSSTKTNSVEVSIYATYTGTPTSQGVDPGNECFFGDTLVGGILSTFENQIVCGGFVSDFTGLIDTIVFWIDWNVLGTNNFKCALYTSSDLTIVANSQTSARLIVGAADAWEAFVFPGTHPSVVSGTSYLIACWADTSSPSVVYSRSRNAGGSSITRKLQAATYGTWPSPLTGIPTTNRTVSCHVKYFCPVSGVKPRRRRIMQERGGNSLLWEAKCTFAGFDLGEVER